MRGPEGRGGGSPRPPAPASPAQAVPAGPGFRGRARGRVLLPLRAWLQEADLEAVSAGEDPAVSTWGDGPGSCSREGACATSAWSPEGHLGPSPAPWRRPQQGGKGRVSPLPASGRARDPSCPASLISTDATARGIDVQGVQLVVNYDAPQYLRTYVHRCGTGPGSGEGVAWGESLVPTALRGWGPPLWRGLCSVSGLEEPPAPENPDRPSRCSSRCRSACVVSAGGGARARPGGPGGAGASSPHVLLPCRRGGLSGCSGKAGYPGWSGMTPPVSSCSRWPRGTRRPCPSWRAPSG